MVLWELLTGQPLFKGSNDAAVVARVLEGVVAPPSKLVPSVPPELDAIVARGLAREPDDRFPSAEAMAEALEGLSHSTTARQVGAWVGHVAGEVIRRRAEQIALIEGAPSTPGLVVAAPVPGPSTETSTLEVQVPEAKTEVRLATPAATAPPRRGPGAAMIAALVAGTALLGVLAAFAFVGARGAAPSSSSPATPGESATVTAPPPSEPTAVSEAPSAPIASAAPSSPPSASAQPTALPQRPHPRPSGPAAPNCNPPYYMDPSGIRRVKPQCL